MLQGEHPPIADSLIGKVYYGDPSVVRWLRIIPALQASMAAILLLAWVYIVRTRGDAARERLWAGMARESAHQLGTPLSSLAGWIELMEERAHGRVVGRGGAAHARRPRSTRPRRPPVRAHRARGEVRRRRRRRARRPRRPLFPGAGTDARQHDRGGARRGARSAEGEGRRRAPRVGHRGADEERHRRARGPRRPRAVDGLALGHRGRGDSRRRRRPGRTPRAEVARVRARLLHQAKRMGDRPLAREANRRGKPQRRATARAVGAGRRRSRAGPRRRTFEIILH